MNLKKSVALLLVLLMMVSMVACSNKSTPGNAPATDVAKGIKERSFNLAMDSPENTVTFLFAEKFKALVEEKSAGKIKIQVYSAGAMGNDREITEGVQAGNLDFGVQTTAPQVNFVPELAIFDMANVFPNAEIARATLDGPFSETLDGIYQKYGFKLLGYADQGFRTLTSNKPVEKFEDFKGQKIRTMENPNHLEYWKALGANPTPMAWGEVYIGLQQKAIDGQENPYEVIVANKIYEQQKYVINTNHIFHSISLITNNSLYDGFSAEEKSIIDEAALEAKVWAREQADERVAERVKIMKDNGVTILDISNELQAQMVEKAQTVYDIIRGKVGNDLVDNLLKSVEDAK